MLSFLRKLGTVLARLKGGAQAAVAEPFETSCECGAKVSGMRRATWIEAECQSCFQSVFILPANVYPTTKRVSSSVLTGSFLTRLRVVVEEVFPKKSVIDVAKADTATASQPATVAAGRPRFHWPEFDVAGMLRRTFTPFRLLMLAVMSVIGLTGYWMIHQRSVEAAQQTWIRAADDIEALLQQRKLASLESLLTEAVAAGRVLKKSDSEWRHMRNLLDEAHAVNNIATVDLLTAFHNAYDNRIQLLKGGEEKIRQATESGIYVFESWLREDPTSSHRFLIDLPATPGENSVEVRIPLPAISELFAAASDGRVLFAGTVSSVVAPEEGAKAAWQLTIDPASFVLITSTVLCDELGLFDESDAELTALLDRQQEFVMSSSTWERRNDSVVSEVEPQEATR